MATIDLGKIKFNWRNEYDNSTAYVPDDCVYYADGSVTSSYICKTASQGNAPSSGGTLHGSWDYLAQGQAPIPTTTQGDIVVRGASTNERLAIGSAGQILKVNSSGNGLEYAQAGVVQTNYKTITAATTVLTDTAYETPAGFSHTITPTSASNHILVTFNVCYASQQQYGSHRITRTVSGGSEVVVPGSVGDQVGSRRQGTDGNNYALAGDNHGQGVQTMMIIDKTHNTTNAITYKLQIHSYNGQYTYCYNRSHADDNDTYSYRGISTIILQEVPPTS